MDPIPFQPIYKQRIWGGRSLESIYDRTLPDESNPYGESWDLSDRAEDQSVVSSGSFMGLTLNELWSNHKEEVFGSNLPDSPRFPLLIKILDCQQDLSLQVHPPVALAEDLGGEPKTEMWYIDEAAPDAQIYVGFKNGVTKEIFEQALQDGSAASYVHTLEPKKGEFLHMDSGRIHAIGGGFLIYEVQQNSDTTYRVFDWNRLGLEGQPRPLHIEKSLACIDFDDIEPSLGTIEGSTIADCPFFKVDKFDLNPGETLSLQNPDRFSIITVISGKLTMKNDTHFCKGDTFILPRKASPLHCSESTEFLETTLPPT